MNESDTLSRLKNKYKDIIVYMNHSSNNINGADLIVYSAAISKDNEERLAGSNNNIPEIERSVLLGEVTKRYKKSIAVSGTHGKTSTSAMLTHLLSGAGFDPSAVIGGKLPFTESNGCIGKSDIIVCEACEYVNSFLSLTPYISVILNVDADHLDFFKDLDDIKKSFNKFANQTTGIVFVNGDDKNSLDTIKDINAKVITFGFDENNDYYATNLSSNKSVNEEFDLMYKGKKITRIKLMVPGKHNIYNALASAAVAHNLGATSTDIAENLQSFGGVHRRFEFLGKPGGITIADDFAHHPTELTLTLNAATNMGFNKVWAIFQPHTYSRTSILFDDFVESLKIPDKIIISEILPVREVNTYNIHSKDLTEKIPNSIYIKTFEEITTYIKNNAKSGDLVLTMGGGNVYKCANMILDTLENMYK